MQTGSEAQKCKAKHVAQRGTHPIVSISEVDAIARHSKQT